MNKVFIGGSRQVSRLSAQVKERLDNIIKSEHAVIVGDANGADKAVQKHLQEAAYKNVTVFCSGDSYRNNLGQWQTRHVTPPRGAKGFQFYAAKDREMAREADFGLMIWDGKSAGTVLNVLRLTRVGKKAVLINVPENRTINFKSSAQWDDFLSRCDAEMVADLRERATSDEWIPADNKEPTFLEVMESSRSIPPIEVTSEAELADSINQALATGDSVLVMNALGNIARARGMTQVAKKAGLARESLYRSLSSGGNPEFSTVLKVMAAVGLRLEASEVQAE